MLAGFGAPIGALLLRYAMGETVPLDDLLAHRFFFLYMAVGTPVAFGAFGFALGRLVETLEDGRESYRRLSNTDVLTGLPNRRAFDAAYAREVARARRWGAPLACLMLDVDRFKAFNDEFGHAAGDDVLRAVSRVLMRVVRETDVAARIGGDEFAVLGPGTSLQEMRVLAERIERELGTEKLRFAESRTLVATVTVGIAAGMGIDAERLLENADRELLSAKRSSSIGG